MPLNDPLIDDTNINILPSRYDFKISIIKKLKGFNSKSLIFIA